MDTTVYKIRQYLLIRLILLYSILVTSVLLRWNGIFNSSVSIAVLALASFSFLMTTAFTLMRERTEKVSYFVNSQVAYDLLFTTALVYYTGINDSIYVTYYLVNIMLTAVIINGYAALVAAIVCGGLYFILAFIASDNFTGERSYLTMTTEISFIVIALLTGQLVDELKRNRARIGRLEKLSDDIVDSLDAGLVGLNAKGRVIRINRAARSMMHLEGNAAGQQLTDLFPAFADVHAPEVREVQIKGEMRRFLVSRVLLPEDATMYLFRDLTEILDLEEQVKQNEHLASVGSLAASLAHEIRNPIASISGAVQLLQGEGAPQQEQQRLLQLIIRETERVDLLVGQLLRFARSEPVDKQRCNVAHVIEQCVENLRARPEFPSADVVIDFSVNDASAGQTEALSNQEQLIEVFTNILLNAFQALSDMKPRDLKGHKKRIKISLQRRPHEIEVLVSDNGPGIPKEFKGRIFDPFFTTKTYGTGLGLARVYKIIKDHDGRIDLESTPEMGGTTLRVRIPVGA